MVEIEDEEIGIVIELKYAENGKFDAGCEAAMQQIKDNRYDEVLLEHGMRTIYRYGIACYKKRCKVLVGGRNRLVELVGEIDKILGQ